MLYKSIDPPTLYPFIQVLAKEHVYVCPGGGIPGLLPSGILPEAVKSAGNLDSALKQVCVIMDSSSSLVC